MGRQTTFSRRSSPLLLTGQTALITGGGSGIGKAAAMRLAEEGAVVWIAGIDEEELDRSRLEIGRGCQAIRCDITDNQDLHRAIHAPAHLDIFIANAGVSFPTPLAGHQDDVFRKMIEINQWGTMQSCLAAGQRMIAQNTTGRIVLITSILAQLAENGSAAYGMSKAALGQLTRQLACEWAPHNLLVNAIAPGTIHTPMSYVSGENEFDGEWFRNFFIHADRPRLPLRRPGTPEEIAEGILFLCNPRNSYCTGQTLVLDGGLTVAF